jgi:hypothetical protein
MRYAIRITHQDPYSQYTRTAYLSHKGRTSWSKKTAQKYLKEYLSIAPENTMVGLEEA